MTPFSALTVGFVLGLKHATETDHLTAVATLATRQHSWRHIARQGMAWGLGHALMLLGIGCLVLALGQAVPSWLARGLECAVGVMLIVLGADVLRRVWRRSDSFATGLFGQGPPRRALVVGMVHGMAGSAALVVLGLAAMQSPGRALAYILIFGIGSIAGMTVLSAAMAGPLRLGTKWLGKTSPLLSGLIGAFSCGLGVLVLFRNTVLS